MGLGKWEDLRMSRLARRERRASILNAARTVLARKGFHGARAEDFAREADISPALLFRHFPTLKVLQRAVIAGGLSRKPTPWPSKTAGKTLRAALESIGSVFLSTFKNDPDLLRLTFFGALCGRPRAAEPFRREALRAIRRVRSLIQSWQRVGLVRATAEPDTMAWMFVSALMNLAMADRIFGLPRDARRLEHLMDAVEESLTGTHRGPAFSGVERDATAKPWPDSSPPQEVVRGQVAGWRRH